MIFGETTEDLKKNIGSFNPNIYERDKNIGTFESHQTTYNKNDAPYIMYTTKLIATDQPKQFSTDFKVLLVDAVVGLHRVHLSSEHTHSYIHTPLIHMNGEIESKNEVDKMKTLKLCFMLYLCMCVIILE